MKDETAQAKAGAKKPVRPHPSKAQAVLKARKHAAVDPGVTLQGSSTGAIARLTDPDISPGVEKLRQQLLSDPQKAREWLQELGYLTAGGNISSRYGGR